MDEFGTGMWPGLNRDLVTLGRVLVTLSQDLVTLSQDLVTLRGIRDEAAVSKKIKFFKS